MFVDTSFLPLPALLSTQNLIQLPQQSPGGLLTTPPRLGLQAQVGRLSVCVSQRDNQTLVGQELREEIEARRCCSVGLQVNTDRFLQDGSSAATGRSTVSLLL